MAAKSKHSSATSEKSKARAASQSQRAREQEGTWSAVLNPELTYKAPTSPLARALYRWRLWFEATFVFTLLEPWEKGLLLAIAFIVFTLLFVGLWKYLPYQIVFLYGRAKYYLHG